MRRSKKITENESGLAVVEAAILLPVCIIMVVAIYYAAIFMCQKANMQANLQNALVYYKNVDSDTYVSADAGMDYSRAAGDSTKIYAKGSGYSVSSSLFPYRFFAMKFDSGAFESFFRSMCGYMFFDSGENITLTTDASNYVIYKTIRVTAEQTVMPAVSMSLIGLSDSLTISATCEVVISNGDDFVRNVDFITDLLKDTKLGEAAADLVDKAAEFYNKFKEKFDK